jgi:hypothetical protein
MEDEVSDILLRWDGGPNRVLPGGAMTDYLDFLIALEEEALPETAGADIAEGLKKGSIRNFAAGEVACESGSSRALVVLWLPFFHDQRMFVADGEHLEHVERAPLTRWGDTESAISVLSLGFPSRPVELGFFIGEQNTVLPWFEFCQYYQLAPQYAVASWS